MGNLEDSDKTIRRETVRTSTKVGGLNSFIDDYLEKEICLEPNMDDAVPIEDDAKYSAVIAERPVDARRVIEKKNCVTFKEEVQQ